MAEPSDPVSADEYVLRRILNMHDRVSPDLPIQVFYLAFRPDHNDADGLSVYRALFVTPQELARAGPNPKGYFVARLKVADILAIGGLTVQPTPNLGELPGHASIPELTPASNKGPTKNRAREQMLALAELASKDIVHRPNG